VNLSDAQKQRLEDILGMQADAFSLGAASAIERVAHVGLPRDGEEFQALIAELRSEWMAASPAVAVLRERLS
jgi:hypothetical protein